MGKEAYDKALELLKEYLNKNSTITTGEFRDLLNTNRKVTIALLEYFDQIKITKGKGTIECFTNDFWFDTEVNRWRLEYY